MFASSSRCIAAAICGLSFFMCAIGAPVVAAPTVLGHAVEPQPMFDQRSSPTTVEFERAIAGRHFPTVVRPIVGAAATSAKRLRVQKAHSLNTLVVNVPLGGDVAAAAGAVDEAGGGIVQLAAGTYHLTSTIPLDNNLTIQGQGSSTIIQSPATPHGFAMMANVAQGIGNIVIQNLVLDGNIPPGAFGTGVYNGAGIYIVALDNAVSPVTISNVEVKNTSIGLILDGVNNINVSNSYIHDNNPGFFSHNAYFIACTGVSISHSRFDHAHTGDGLHFDFGSSVYTISKSEFSGNNGIGILDQGGVQETVRDTIANGNQNDGFNMSSNSSSYYRLESDNNWAFGYDNGGGSGGAFGLIAFNDGGGFGQFFGYGFALLLNATTPNQYLGILAQGPLGIVDTADWSTAYGGYSTIGYVDFNANHLANGLLTFNAGSVGSGTTGASFRYSNGTSNTLRMSLNVNGAPLGSILFPPTGGGSTWSTMNFNVPLKDGNNVISVRPLGTAAPELDYLTINEPVPAPPAAPAVTVAATSPYTVTLSWRAVPGAQSYNVFKSGDGAPLATGVTATTFTDNTILVGDSANTYVVQAVNAGGGGPGTAVSITTPLDAPTGFQVSAVTGGFFLSWIGVNGAASYVVGRATSNNGPYYPIATTSGTSYTDTTGVSGGSYYYALKSVNATGSSALSYPLAVNVPTGSQQARDIGSVGIAGLTDFNAGTGAFTLSGGGSGVYTTADAFHFEYLPVTGDVTMTAYVSSLQAVTAATQMGIDIRSSLAANAPDAFVGLTGSSGAVSLVRSTASAATVVDGNVPGIVPGYYVEMIRSGNTFTSAISSDGLTWTNIATTTISMPANVYIGLAASSTIHGKLAVGLFDSVTTVGTVTPSAVFARGAQAVRRFNVRLPRV